MKYAEAYELVKDGKHVKRAFWDHPDHASMRLFLIPESPMVWVIQNSANVAGGINCGAYTCSVEDLEANDWCEIPASWNEFHKLKNECADVQVPVDAQVM